MNEIDRRKFIQQISAGIGLAMIGVTHTFKGQDQVSETVKLWNEEVRKNSAIKLRQARNAIDHIKLYVAEWLDDLKFEPFPTDKEIGKMFKGLMRSMKNEGHFVDGSYSGMPMPPGELYHHDIYIRTDSTDDHIHLLFTMRGESA